MHIVLANRWFPPESGWGGVGMYNYAVAHAYIALGHQVTVIASRASLAIAAESETDGICVRRILVRDAYRARRVPVAGRYVRPIQQLAYARRVDRELRELDRARPIDVVEFAEVNAEGFFYARDPGAPVVVRCHTPTFVFRDYFLQAEVDYETRIISACERDLIRRAASLTAPSRDMARVVAANCGFSPRKITVIPNAVATAPFDKWRDTTRVPDSSDRITVLYVGRFERVKGISVLAEAIPQVLERAPNIDFLFVGYDRPTPRGISQRAELEERLAADGVRGHAEFLPAVEQDRLPDLYGRADICVVPSLLYESFSYTCALAMAAGKPVVASRVGGIPETVEDGVTGLLFEAGDSRALAEAITNLTSNPGRRLRMGCAGRQKVEKEFDPLLVAERILSVYKEAQNGRRTPAP